MSSTHKVTELNTAAQLQEQQTGASTRTIAPLPELVPDRWGLKYGEYVRISLVSDEDGPQLTVAPMGDMSYRERANDLKLTKTDSIPLPRRLVRLFGIKNDIWWEAFDNQLVGGLMGYNDAGTLFETANHYTDYEIPREDPFDEGGEPPRRTTFPLLLNGVNPDDIKHFSESNPSRTYKHRTSVRHSLPDGRFGFEDGDKFSFVLFHDGEGFIVGLLPAPASISVRDQALDDHPETIHVNTAYLPKGGSIVAKTLDGDRIGHTDQFRDGVHKDIELELYDSLEEPTRVILTAQHDGVKYEFNDEPVATSIALTLDGDEPEPLPDGFSFAENNNNNGADAYSMTYNPLSASPYDEPESTDSNLPEIVLDYEKDTVTVHETDDGDAYYTIPKQVADALWLEDGYMTDWVHLSEDAYLGRLTPESRSQVRERGDPTYLPTT